MEFNIIYNKFYNQYFFIKNLSNWHPFIRKSYNRLWYNILNPLTNEEKSSLNKFKKILQQRGYNNRSLDTIFYYYEIKSLKDINNNPHLTIKEKGVILKTFKTLKDKFEKWWQKNKAGLIINLIKRRVNNADFKKIIQELETFFNNKRIKEVTIFIYLVPDRENFGGHAQILKGKYFIELEIPPLISKIDTYLLLLLHEVAHLLSETPYLDKIIKCYLDDTSGQKIQNLRELIIHKLAPDGYFTTILLKTTSPNDITSYYLENKKKIDLNYLREVIKK